MEFSCSYVGYVYGDGPMFKTTIVVCAVLNSVLSIPTFCLNLSVVIAVLRCKDLSDVTKVFFANLALSDLLTACFSQLAVSVQFTLLSLRESPCVTGEFTSLVSFIVVSVSISTSVCLSFDRYVCIMYPFVYSTKATKQKAILTIAFIWLVSTGVVLPSALKRTIVPIEIFATFGGLCFGIMSMICYIRVCLLTRRVRRQIRTEQRRFDNTSTWKMESKLLFTTCLIVSSFFCCYVPYQLVCLFKLANIQGIPSNFVYWAWTIAHLNALINPLVTCWQLSSIRNGILSLWKMRSNPNTTVRQMVVKSAKSNGTDSY